MSTPRGRRSLPWTTGPFVVLLWLHQGARAERSLTAWCPKTMRYKPPQGLFSQAPSHNGSLGSSQHTDIFSSHFPLVLGEISIPSAAAVQSSLEESGCKIHKDGIGSGLSEDEGSKGDHEHPIADLGPPAVDAGGQGIFRGVLHPNIHRGIGERGG